MNDQEKSVRLEGIVHASRYDAKAAGKQFLGAAIECSDAKVWVIDYEEQSPFHAFAGRQVVAFGEPYEPAGQFLIGWGGGKTFGHFRPSCVRLVQVTDDAELVEIGAPDDLRGRFERGMANAGESMLSFVTEKGDAFVVTNDPAGATVDLNLEVLAYPVQPSPSIRRPPGRY